MRRPHWISTLFYSSHGAPHLAPFSSLLLLNVTSLCFSNCHSSAEIFLAKLRAASCWLLSTYQIVKELIFLNLLQVETKTHLRGNSLLAEAARNSEHGFVGDCLFAAWWKLATLYMFTYKKSVNAGLITALYKDCKLSAAVCFWSPWSPCFCLSVP